MSIARYHATGIKYPCDKQITSAKKIWQKGINLATRASKGNREFLAKANRNPRYDINNPIPRETSTGLRQGRTQIGAIKNPSVMFETAFSIPSKECKTIIGIATDGCTVKFGGV